MGQDIRGKFVKFDGNVPHATEAFEGERYSVIYFTNQHYEDASEPHLKALAEMGFNLSEPGLRKKEYGSKGERLARAKKSLPDVCVHRRVEPEDPAEKADMVLAGCKS